MRQRRPSANRLSSRDRGVLDLERKWGTSASAVEMKLAEAKEHLGLSPSGYALVLTSLLDDPVAEAEDPDTIHRLRAARSDAASTFGPVRRF